MVSLPPFSHTGCMTQPSGPDIDIFKSDIFLFPFSVFDFLGENSAPFQSRIYQGRGAPQRDGPIRLGFTIKKYLRTPRPFRQKADAKRRYEKHIRE